MADIASGLWPSNGVALFDGMLGGGTWSMALEEHRMA